MTTLMAIGGAVDAEESSIFQEFIRRAGGREARIVVLPQASSLPETGREYVRVFKKLGVKNRPVSLEFRERVQADRKRHLELLQKATGVFIAGGTQMRLTSLLGGTRFEEELLAAYRRGAVIVGTSAGTAVQSKLMIACGRSGPTPREGIARFGAGFGFTDGSSSTSTFASGTGWGGWSTPSPCIPAPWVSAWMKIRLPSWRMTAGSPSAGGMRSRLWMGGT